MRASWRRLLFFFVCIGIGVGSIVALRSMIRNVDHAVAGQARLLLTADVQIDSTRPWSAETLAALERVAQPPLVEAKAETIEAPTMMRPADASREGAMLIDLKGIEPPFPLYGDFTLVNGTPFDYSLLENNGAVVATLILERLSLKIGDEIKIGYSTFQIRGAIDHEPGGGGFRVGPRVFIARSAVEATGLTGFGSRARRKVLYKTTEAEMPRLVSELRASIRDRLIGIRSYKNAEENLNNQFERTEDYLSLTGLVILVLGGIGISNVTRVFIDQKKKTIAVLKCLGGTGRRITATYLLQIITLGLAGSVFGIALAKVALFCTGRYFADVLPEHMSYSLELGAAAQGLLLGLLVSILFSALPLLRVRHIKPNMLLRDQIATARRRFDPGWLATAVLVVLGLVLVASWQAGSLRVGLVFLAGLAVTAAALYLAASLTISLVRRARHLKSFALRQAINSLYRPGNQTRVIVMAVGLGVFLVIATRSLQTNLVREFDLSRNGGLPNMFLIDIQKDQAGGVADIVQRATGERPNLISTIRARIAAINGRTIDLEQDEMKRDRGRLGREYTVTYRSHLDTNERIVDGKFWDATPSAAAEVSLEESMRGLLGLDLGSTVTFDIAGRKLTAMAGSFRHVDWRNSRTGFMVLFRPGSLDDAPQTMIAAINAPTAASPRARFERDLLDRYPNVSVIDVMEVVQVVKRIVDNITLAVSFLGGFVILSGVLILAGAIAMTKFQRIYEAAVLKTLGAKRKVLLTIMVAEYGLLGLVAGVIGSVAAAGLSYATSRYVFKIPWSFTPSVNLAGALATVLLVTLTGALASFDVLSKKPLAILRAQ